MQPTDVFQKTYDLYKHLYQNLRAIPKRERFTWGQRCDSIALTTLELAMQATIASRTEKRIVLYELSKNIDILKIVLRLGNELDILDHHKYIARTAELVEIGKMVGGWIKTVS